MKTLAETVGKHSLKDFLKRCHPNNGVAGFKFFAEHVIGLDIQPFHAEWVQAFLEHQYSCIVASRQIGKCIAEGELVLKSDGSLEKIENIKSGEQLIVLDDNYKLTTSNVVAVASNGVKDCVQINLINGKSVRCTPNHKFLTVEGWKEAQELGSGNFIATPREYHITNTDYNIEDRQIKLMAYYVAEGCRNHPRICNESPQILEELQEIAKSYSLRLVDYGECNKALVTQHSARNPFISMLKEWLLYDKHSYEKQLPDFVFQFSNRQITLLINRLFACDGWCCITKNDSVQIGYGTSSVALATQMHHLLLRLGILSSINKKKTKCKDVYQILIGQQISIKKFIYDVGIFRKPSSYDAIITKVNSITNGGIDDRIPKEYQKYLTHSPGWYKHHLKLCLENYNISRTKLQKIVSASSETELERVAYSDIYWCEIKNINSINSLPTYDLQIEGTHNFIVNDIITHNTECLAVSFPIWIALFNTNKSILITSNAMHVSTEILRRLKTHIYNNELLQQLKGPVWSKTCIITSTGVKIECKPFGDTIRGGVHNWVLCHPPSTVVDINGDCKQINQIKVGDFVKSHTGKMRRVTRVFKQKWNHGLYHIEAGYNKLACTGYHPIILKRNYGLHSFPACRVKVGDKVAYPIHGRSGMLHIARRGEHKLPPYVLINRDTARFFGLWAAEGSVDNTGIRFTFNAKTEQHLIDEVLSLGKKIFGINGGVDRFHSHSHSVIFNSAALRQTCIRHFGKGAHNKKIPDVIKKSNDIHKCIFIRAWLEGDGHLAKRSGSYTGYVGTTVSETLVQDIQELASGLSMNTIARVVHREIYDGVMPGTGPCYDVRFSASSTRKLLTLCEAEEGERSYAYIPIKSVTKKHYSGYVYNLDVEEDHTFIADGVAVHNCDEAGTYKDKNIFFSAAVPTTAKTGGHVMCIGTPTSNTDLLAELRDSSKFYYKTYPMTNAAGDIIWPNAYNKRKLEDIKEKIGSLRYAREFLLKIMDDQQQIFPPSSILKALDKDLGFQYKMERGYNYYMGWDLAMSPQGDYTVGTVIYRDTLERFVVSHIYRVHGIDYTFQQKKISDVYRTFVPRKTYLDESVFGKVLVNDLMREEHVACEGFKFTPDSRNSIINNLIRLFETEKIVIPRKGSIGNETGLTDQLIKELSDMTSAITRSGLRTYKCLGAHDDMVMSLAMACYAAGNTPAQNVGLIVGGQGDIKDFAKGDPLGLQESVLNRAYMTSDVAIALR